MPPPTPSLLPYLSFSRQNLSVVKSPCILTSQLPVAPSTVLLPSNNISSLDICYAGSNNFHSSSHTYAPGFPALKIRGRMSNIGRFGAFLNKNKERMNKVVEFAHFRLPVVLKSGLLAVCLCMILSPHPEPMGTCLVSLCYAIVNTMLCLRQRASYPVHILFINR